MITIVDYDAGNITSVQRALAFVGIESQVSADPAVLLEAQRIIFPGVGHATSAMETLRKRGLDSALHAAFDAGIPILGICLGTQIIFSSSEEGDTKTLGLIPGKCIRFDLAEKALKVPHMGWNELELVRSHFLLKNLKPHDEVYYVHSYYPVPDDSSCVYARCKYGTSFATAVGYKNLFAVQFHPEKSADVGLQILRNFAEWDGTNAE